MQVGLKRHNAYHVGTTPSWGRCCEYVMAVRYAMATMFRLGMLESRRAAMRQRPLGSKRPALTPTHASHELLTPAKPSYSHRFCVAW